MEQLLRELCELWLRQFRFAKEKKEEDFGEMARLAWKFLGHSWTELYAKHGDVSDMEKEFQFPDAKQQFYKPRMNLSGKYLATMLPYVLARVPHRLVTPSRPPLPPELLELFPQVAQGREQLDVQDQMRAWLLEWWLNYLAADSTYGLMREAKTCAAEALIKGMGVVWHEMTPSPTGLIPGSFFDTIDDVYIDSDARERRNAGVLFRERTESIWRIAEKFGLDPSVLRGQYKSRASQAAEQRVTSDSDEPGKTQEPDVGRYIEVYSRMGIGQRFHDPGAEVQKLQDALDKHGPYVYLAIMEGVPYPLNLGPGIAQGGLDSTVVHAALEWEIPFHEEASNPWPCSFLDFLPKPGTPWATSTLAAGLPLQVFIDHLYSFIMGAVRRRCKGLIITSKELTQAVDDAIDFGLDMEHVKYSGPAGAELNKLIHAVEFPEVHKDLYNLIPLVERAFEEMTGMDPLLSSGQVGRTQPRSAAEMQIRDARVSTRPDDYADSVEAFMSAVAAKEAQVTRMEVGPEVVAPLFGEGLPETFDPDDPTSLEATFAGFGPLSQQWALLVNTPNPAQAAAELSYTVEAGSGRRKNRQKQVEDLQTIAQMAVPILTQYMQMTGDTGPINAYLRMIQNTLDSKEMADMQLPDLTALVAQQQEQEQAAKKPQEAA